MASRKPPPQQDAASSSVSQASPPDLSILGVKLSIHPSGITSETSASSAENDSRAPEAPTKKHSEDAERNLISQMSRFRASPFAFLQEAGLHITGTGWRAYDDIIGQPVFYPGFSEAMTARVLSNPLLIDKIRELARLRTEKEAREGMLGNWHGYAMGRPAARDKEEARRREIEAQLREVAEQLVDTMICKMESRRFIRGAYYLTTSLLTRAYHQGIHVSSAEVLRLRDTAKRAHDQGISIVFLPSHRSHVDYVSLQIICYRLGISLPTVVAGDNLNFPVVGPFLQSAGAMWIRRSFDSSDPLYTTTVQAYIDTLLQNGFNFECFIEGGRSRTGKLLSPKFGILRFILDGVLSGRVKDCLVVPVSTQYDKVVEVDSYVSELLGQPKAKENLADFLTGGSSVLSLKLGRVDVRFHEPWSLKVFCEEQMDRFVGAVSGQGLAAGGGDGGDRTWTEDRRLRLLRTLGYKVLSEINDVSVVMPTALIGTVLLTLRGRGVGKSELIRRVEWLSERVRHQGGRVAHFAGISTETVVERGLDVLGPNLVGVVGGLAEETYYAVDRFQLSFYRNMTIHLFILEALVCAGLYTKVKVGGAAEYQRMGYEELRSYVYFLSQLFRAEFIFPPEGLDANLEKAFRSLEADDVITVARVEGRVEFVELSANERESGRENYDFYCFLIWPFIEAAWLGVVSLMMLTPPLGYDGDGALEMKKVQDQAQLLGKTLYHQGDLSYFEAVNKETLKNSYEKLQDEGVIVVSRSKESKVPPTVRLADDWRPKRRATDGKLIPEGRLWTLGDTISHSRREGKNRRDGKTVITRVLTLADLCGRQLFEDAKGNEAAGADSKIQDAGTSPRRRRRISETTAKL